MLTTAVTAMHLRPDEVLHDIPLAQLFALSACHAWFNGLNPSNGTYEDKTFERELARVKEAAAAAL